MSNIDFFQEKTKSKEAEQSTTFCMKLLTFIFQEQKENNIERFSTEANDLYDLRLQQLRTGECYYKWKCNIYKRTMEKRGKINEQLKLF